MTTAVSSIPQGRAGNPTGKPAFWRACLRWRPRYTGIIMAATESGTIAVLAEKPSVARDIARVLGATRQSDGYRHGNGYVITWAIGHLAALAQPHEIHSQWRQWRRDLLPMLPDRWPLVVYEKTKDQFEVVRKILNSPRIARMVCATD